LKYQGHHVFVAEDGAQGIGVAAPLRRDVVVLYVGMPVLAGHSTLHVLKSDPKMSGIPVVVLTSHDNTQRRERLQRAGCAGFLGNPFDLTDLHQEIAKNLQANPV